MPSQRAALGRVPFVELTRSSLLVVVVALAEVRAGALGHGCGRERELLVRIPPRAISDPRTPQIAGKTSISGHIGSHPTRFWIQVNSGERTTAVRRMGEWSRFTTPQVSRSAGSARGRKRGSTTRSR